MKKAKELMNEAKEMATNQSEEAKKAVNEKIAAIMSQLEQPSDWFKQDEVKQVKQVKRTKVRLRSLPKPAPVGHSLVFITPITRLLRPLEGLSFRYSRV